MTAKSIAAATFFLLLVVNVQAANKSEKIKVNGQCDMCKSRIENAVNSLDGVASAQWNKSDKCLTVSYDDTKTAIQKIQTSIAMAGHDTEMFSASQSGYNKLPGCCRYKRDVNRKKNMHGSTEMVNKKSEKAGSCCNSKQ